MIQCPDLDHPALLHALDPGGMLTCLENFAAQCREAIDLGLQMGLPEAADVRSVAVCGMGGSAIGADLVRSYAWQRLAVPFVVVRHYSLPACVGPHTLIFAISYSGNTEETLQCYREARQRRAQVVVVSTGGRLGYLAKADGVPFLRVPAGLAPRAALGYLSLPILAVLSRLGLLEGADAMDTLPARLERVTEELAADVPEAVNPAKRIARRLLGRLPVIVGATGSTDAVAARWRGQLNENAKVPAFCAYLPEMHHNQIVGLVDGAIPDLPLEVVLLQDPEDLGRVCRRISLTRELLRGKAGVTLVSSGALPPLARLFGLACLGDFVSVYLAMLRRIDPTPIPAIDAIKSRLD